MNASPLVQSAVGEGIASYLALKQALGRRFTNETYVLHNLERFLAEQASASPMLNAETFSAWCLTLAHLSPTSRRTRMRVVRNLCLYLRRSDPSCFVPDPSAFPSPQQARRPHIFGEQEIIQLLKTASELPPRSTSPLRSQTYRLAVVLLYTAGLRRGELVRLALSDYDPIERTLLIRASKFHKSRLVALSADAAAEMEAYLVARRGLPHDAHSPLLVRSGRGLHARSGGGFGQGMRRLFRLAGLRTASGGLPRVHDLRHTHALHALLRWYRAGADVQARLPALATSMGHVSVVSTAYYLAMLEPVARAACDLFARHAAPMLPATGGEP